MKILEDINEEGRCLKPCIANPVDRLYYFPVPNIGEIISPTAITYEAHMAQAQSAVDLTWNSSPFQIYIWIPCLDCKTGSIKCERILDIKKLIFHQTIFIINSFFFIYIFPHLLILLAITRTLK